MLNLVLSYRSTMKSLLLIGQLQIIIGIFLTKSLVPNQIWNISHQNFTYRCALQTFDTKVSYSLALKLFQMSYFIMSDFHLQISPRTHILLLLSQQITMFLRYSPCTKNTSHSNNNTKRSTNPKCQVYLIINATIVIKRYQLGASYDMRV